ncbi:hypothetical protein HJ01_02434 [Flavobacterium frigoris PS1]|uniref:Uncharacterized protein n=1 Tax=Flavobacterium frigoris (strain PS1) TaxID=1086011 RepID=H7FT15_FLAFP|nr:hypothetical protein HJ01_02434 [Flavobacterium frigoris PS1]
MFKDIHLVQLSQSNSQKIEIVYLHEFQEYLNYFNYNQIQTSNF